MINEKSEQEDQILSIDGGSRRTSSHESEEDGSHSSASANSEDESDSEYVPAEEGI
jgi:hypothetical protein